MQYCEEKNIYVLFILSGLKNALTIIYTVCFIKIQNFKSWCTVHILTYKFYQGIHGQHLIAKLLEGAEPDVVLRLKSSQRTIKWQIQDGKPFSVQWLTLWYIFICIAVDNTTISIFIINKEQQRYSNSQLHSQNNDFYVLIEVKFSYPPPFIPILYLHVVLLTTRITKFPNAPAAFYFRQTSLKSEGNLKKIYRQLVHFWNVLQIILKIS